MQIELLIGPPGTGKTTEGLRRVEEFLAAGIPPEQIAYLSFTRKAAQEAINRACAKFEFTRKQFPHFRTLHSLAFGLLKLSRTDVMGPQHYKELGDTIGLTFSQDYNENTQLPSLSGDVGDKCMKIYYLSKARRTTVREEWERGNEIDLPFFIVDRFARTLEDYKRMRHLLDFTDFLDQCHHALPVKVMIVDEAQDLTPQQWDFVRRLWGNAEHVVVAGDDDQAIYEWAGADVQQLLALEGKRTVLPVSYRLPREVFAYANDIAGRIESRIPKDWAPRPEEGEVNELNSMEDLVVPQDRLKNESWMVLARENMQLKDAEVWARLQGVPYTKNHRLSTDEPYVKAIIEYERLRRDEPADTMLAQSFRSLKGFDFSQDWMVALDRISINQREYIRALRRNGYSLTKPENPMVLSTIHGSKGGEADNVVLLSKHGKRTRNDYERNPDPELRVWYVGVTRAKQRLYVIGYNHIWRK